MRKWGAQTGEGEAYFICCSSSSSSTSSYCWYMIGIQWSGNPNSGFDEERGKFSVSKRARYLIGKSWDQLEERGGRGEDPF